MKEEDISYIRPGEMVILPYGENHEKGPAMCVECGMRTDNWLEWMEDARGVVTCPACGKGWTWAMEGRCYKTSDGWFGGRPPYGCMEVGGDLGWRGFLRFLKGVLHGVRDMVGGGVGRLGFLV